MTFLIGNPSVLRSAISRGSPIGNRLELHFTPAFTNGHAPCSAGELAELLEQNCEGLTHLLLYNVNIEGDFLMFLDALRRLKNLKYFWAQSCCFDSALVADVMIHLPALETLAMTRHFRPQNNDSLDRIPISIMTQLVREGHLKDLRLDPMAEFRDLAEAVEFFAAVRDSPRMTRLWCLSAFTDPYIEAMAEMLKHDTTLQELKASVAPQASPIKPVAEALFWNTSLTHLTIQMSRQPTKAELESFLLPMESNFALKELNVAKDTKWSNEKRRQLPVYTSSNVREVYNKLEFYLALNNAGRRALLNDNSHAATTEDWLSAIAYQEDPSIIYYYARANPFLILPQSLGGLIPPPTEETRFRDRAKRAAKYSYLFSDTSSQHLELWESKHVKDAMLISPRPVKVLQLDFLPQATTTTVTAKDLAALLGRFSSTLEKIVLHHVTVEGPIDVLLESIKNTKSVKHLVAHGVQGIDFDRLVGVLSRLRGFNSLAITEGAPRLTFRTLTSLVQKQPIQVLQLRGMDPPVRGNEISEVAAFLDAVQKSPTLKDLTCCMSHGHFTTAHMAGIKEMICYNTVLQKLELLLANEGKNMSLQPFAYGLYLNSSLQQLVIRVKGASPQDLPLKLSDMQAFSFMLKESTTTVLHSLKISNDAMDDGVHLWKPQYGRNEEEQQLLQEIEDLLAQKQKQQKEKSASINSSQQKEATRKARRATIAFPTPRPTQIAPVYSPDVATYSDMMDQGDGGAVPWPASVKPNVVQVPSPKPKVSPKVLLKRFLKGGKKKEQN